jgi:glutathione S-transferase
MPHYTAIVTLLAVGFYLFTSLAVASARVKFGIKAPATAGHPDFERAFRVQMNTLESMPLFLPSLWLFAL